MNVAGTGDCMGVVVGKIITGNQMELGGGGGEKVWPIHEVFQDFLFMLTTLTLKGMYMKLMIF